jgi:photosystem II stability/assembly factor-like uncharacterized protein
MNKAFKAVLYVCFLTALTLTCLSQTNPWKKMQSPVNSTLRRLTFVDSLTGWAAGESGTIIHTTDGGNNWKLQNSTVQTFITDVFFVSKTIGWATTLRDTFPFNTVILKTTNGGDSWIAEDFQDSTAFMRTIFFFDSLNGFVGGTYIAYTSDGGNSWTKADVDSNMVSTFPVYEFNFYNHQFGYACGGRLDVAGVVWRTTNYGLNWAAQGISADEIFDVFIFDSLNAITLSGDPEGLYAIAKIKTTDAGFSWNHEDLLFYGLSFTIDFRTYNEGWSASGYKFLFTSDRGENWGEFETPDSAVIYDLQFTDVRTGYAVGENGVILKLKSAYEPAGVEEQNSPLNTFILYQNYPNPFNPSTKICYTIPNEGKVKLIIYDILGTTVITLVDKIQILGSYCEIIDGSKFASGIYFIRLSFNDQSTIKKMILIK